MDAEVSPKVGAYNVSGSFDLTFSCKPQQYLKSGERRQILTGSGTVYNPTLFDARPLLRIYGTGQVIIGDVTVTVTECDEYTDIREMTESTRSDMARLAESTVRTAQELADQSAASANAAAQSAARASQILETVEAKGEQLSRLSMAAR